MLNGAYPAGAVGSENDPIGAACGPSRRRRSAPEWKLAAKSVSLAVRDRQPLVDRARDREAVARRVVPRAPRQPAIVPFSLAKRNSVAVEVGASPLKTCPVIGSLPAGMVTTRPCFTPAPL